MKIRNDNQKNGCPRCGETNGFYFKDTKTLLIPKGISLSTEAEYIDGVEYEKFCFKCYTCGNEWEELYKK